MSETRTLYLIRHGQTEWNRAKRLQGSKDSPLTEIGRHQAARIAQALESAPPSHMLTSPLGRAKTTASMIAAHLSIDDEEDARLAEMRFGAAEGLTADEIDARWPGFRKKREQDKWHIRWPDGECYDDVDRRMASLINDAIAPQLNLRAAQPFAIVAHEAANIVLLGRLLRLPPSLAQRISQPNNVVYRVRDRTIDHAQVETASLNWIPGLLLKDSDEILSLEAPVMAGGSGLEAVAGGHFGD